MQIVLIQNNGPRKTFEVKHDSKAYIVSTYGLLVIKTEVNGEAISNHTVEDAVEAYLMEYYGPKLKRVRAVKRTPTDQMLLPEVKAERVPCGHTLIGWDTAIVYVRNKHNPHSLPTHMRFSFACEGDAFTYEVVRLVDQWTWYPGNKCYFRYEPGSHEYNRARIEAIKAVEIYRRNYIAEHGQRPDTLFGSTEEFTQDQIKKATHEVNHPLNKDKKHHLTGWQQSFDFGDP